MASFSHAQGTSSLFDHYDGYVEQVQHVLRVNHVPFGTPFDFLILAQILEHNSQLRNDLAVLLQSFMEGEKRIHHRTALGIIAVASGGPDFTTTSNDMNLQADGMSQSAGDGNQPINVLVDLLMNVGCRTQTEGQNHDGHFESHLDIRSNSSSSELIDDETYQTLPPPSSDHETNFEQFADANSDNRTPLEALPASSNKNSNEDSPLQISSPHSGAEDSLVESLSRLELNALQVKHYLDSIDQRISRIEPRLDRLPAYVPFPATPDPESGSGAGYGNIPHERYSAMVAAETQTQESPDDSSPPDRPHTQTSIPSAMPSLLESSSRQKISRKKVEIPIFTAAALGLLLLFYWGFNQNTQVPAISPVNPQNTAIPQSNPAHATSVNPAPSSQNATARPSPSHAVPVFPEIHHRPLHHSGPALLDASRSSATAIPAASADTDESNDSPSLNTLPVNVSSGVMAANVLSAPQPSSPLLANLTHMRGEVVMQAIISKDGTIENLHVIKGHHLLRGAATNAVRAWRYRPYMLKGQPVAVATTVSVDFN